MNYLKLLGIFIICVILLLFFYYFVRIPIIPVFCLYAFIGFLEKFNCDNSKLIPFLFALLSLLSILLYGWSIVISIIQYPTYLTIFGIILQSITFLNFIGAFILFFPSMLKDLKVSK